MPGLKQSCDAAVARDQRCGETSVVPNCDTVAIAESAEMTSVYDCVAGTACGESPAPCYPQSTDPMLSELVCNAVASNCSAWTCTADGRRLLSSIEPWLRAEAIAAAAACAAETNCRDIMACVEAWRVAVLKDAPYVLLFE
jgi:hypothetical protein